MTIALTRSGSRCRGVPGTRMKPTASAPDRAAQTASRAFVIPQIFTLTIMVAQVVH